MLPQDTAVLFSYVNTKLRDAYETLDALCDDMGEDRAALERRLASAGYVYDAPNNRFVPKP